MMSWSAKFNIDENYGYKTIVKLIMKFFFTKKSFNFIVFYLYIYITQSSQCDTLTQMQMKKQRENQNFQPQLWSSTVVGFSVTSSTLD